MKHKQLELRMVHALNQSERYKVMTHVTIARRNIEDILHHDPTKAEKLHDAIVQNPLTCQHQDVTLGWGRPL